MDTHHNPNRNSSCWIKIDYDSLMSNIQQYAQNAELIDLSPPLFRHIWPYIEDDVLRAGIKGVISATTPVLLSAGNSFEKILKPCSRQSDKGYARTGIVPVISSISECLALSNLAQSLDQRMTFLVHVRSCDSDIPSGDWNLESICERVSTLPMIDLAGFYLRFVPQARLFGYFRRLLHSAEAVSQRMICPRSSTSEKQYGISHYSLWENLAIDDDAVGSFPLEIGCWAHPVRTGSDYHVFQADIGMLHGIPANFPVLIAGEPAKIVRVEADYCEFVVEKPLAGPFPAKALLTGGSAHQSVELREWRMEDLKNLLGHLDNCSIYLKKKSQLIEIIP
ncbi:MAG: hypothetical protein KKB51_15905 [Candidatus Riflebacteria bacterium]|nr:hypothetical protein [Candidatus Riflebacteria bacterium]